MNSGVNSSELLSQPDRFEVSCNYTPDGGEQVMFAWRFHERVRLFGRWDVPHSEAFVCIEESCHMAGLSLFSVQVDCPYPTKCAGSTARPFEEIWFDFGVIRCTSTGWSSNHWAAAWFTRYENYCRSWRFCRTCSLTRWSLPSKKSPRWHLVSRNFDCAACCLAVSLAPWLGPLFSIETTFWISPLFEAGNVVDHGSYSVNVISQRPFAGS